MKYLLVFAIIAAMNSVWMIHRAKDVRDGDCSTFYWIWSVLFWGSHVLTVVAIIVYGGTAIWNRAWW